MNNENNNLSNVIPNNKNLNNDIPLNQEVLNQQSVETTIPIQPVSIQQPVEQDMSKQAVPMQELNEPVMPKHAIPMKEPIQQQPIQQMQTENNSCSKMPIIIAVIVLVLICIGVALYLFFNRNVGSSKNQSVNVITTTTTSVTSEVNSYNFNNYIFNKLDGYVYETNNNELEVYSSNNYFKIIVVSNSIDEITANNNAILNEYFSRNNLSVLNSTVLGNADVNSSIYEIYNADGNKYLIGVIDTTQNNTFMFLLTNKNYIPEQNDISELNRIINGVTLENDTSFVTPTSIQSAGLPQISAKFTD